MRQSNDIISSSLQQLGYFILIGESIFMAVSQSCRRNLASINLARNGRQPAAISGHRNGLCRRRPSLASKAGNGAALPRLSAATRRIICAAWHLYISSNGVVASHAGVVASQRSPARRGAHRARIESVYRNVFIVSLSINGL